MPVSYSLSVYINTPGEKMFSVRRCLANYPCSTEKKNIAMATSLGQPIGGREEEGCGEEARSSEMHSHITHVTIYLSIMLK